MKVAGERSTTVGVALVEQAVEAPPQMRRGAEVMLA